LRGIAAEQVTPGEAVVAIRPEDLTARPDGPIAATVETAEYRGRSFFGTARTPDGLELFFRSEAPVRGGEGVRLGADPDQVLVYGRPGP
jgi:putative spermidine/putrescine transport system ATP-binding protein